MLSTRLQGCDLKDDARQGSGQRSSLHNVDPGCSCPLSALHRFLSSTCLSPCGRFLQEARTLTAELFCSAATAQVAAGPASFRICLSVLISLLLPILPSWFSLSSTLPAKASLPPRSLESSEVCMPNPRSPFASAETHAANRRKAHISSRCLTDLQARFLDSVRSYTD